MYQHNPDIRITGIEREKNAVHMTVNGFSVTAVCSTQDDPGIYESVKHILIGSVAEAYQKGLTKLDKFP